jgi:hypothetical protein
MKYYRGSSENIPGYRKREDELVHTRLLLSEGIRGGGGIAGTRLEAVKLKKRYLA